MASKDSNLTTVVLGNEFDRNLQENLFHVLSSLGAKRLGEYSNVVAGSQEIEYISVKIGDYTVQIEAETYIGLSISGEKDIVLKIKGLLGSS